MEDETTPRAQEALSQVPNTRMCTSSTALRLHCALPHEVFADSYSHCVQDIDRATSWASHVSNLKSKAAATGLARDDVVSLESPVLRSISEQRTAKFRIRSKPDLERIQLDERSEVLPRKFRAGTAQNRKLFHGRELLDDRHDLVRFVHGAESFFELGESLLDEWLEQVFVRAHHDFEMEECLLVLCDIAGEDVVVEVVDVAEDRLQGIWIVVQEFDLFLAGFL